MTYQSLTLRRGSRVFLPDLHAWYTVNNVTSTHTFLTDQYDNTFRVPTHDLLKMAR